MDPPVTAISSRDNALLRRLRKLASDPAAYRKLGEVWIEGEHLCSAYVQKGGVASQAVISEEGWKVPVLRALASRAGRVAIVSAELFAGVSTLESPGPLGFTLALPATDEVLDAHQPSVVLDRLQDAGNVGNVLRSAAAFGFTQIVALKGTAALWSPKVLRAGMGAHFQLRLLEGVPEDELSRLRVPLLASSSHAERELDTARLQWPCAWVIGNEGQGVSKEIAERCAQSLRIPQPGGGESLNVASAAAVCMYESARQRAHPV